MIKCRWPVFPVTAVLFLNSRLIDKKSKEKMPDWTNLISAARDGDDDALGEIVSRVYAYLLLMTDQEMGQGLRAKFGPSDVVQQSMLEAHQSIEQFTGSSESEMRLWLKQIVLHNLFDISDRFRTLSRDTRREINFEFLPPASKVSVGDTPSRRIVREEIDEQLRHAVERLPSRQRYVIEARHRLGRSFTEIAGEMQISPAAVQKIWSRAIENLRGRAAIDHE